MIEYLKLWSDLYMKKQGKKHTSKDIGLDVSNIQSCLTWQKGTHRFAWDKCVSHAI